MVTKKLEQEVHLEVHLCTAGQVVSGQLYSGAFIMFISIKKEKRGCIN